MEAGLQLADEGLNVDDSVSQSPPAVLQQGPASLPIAYQRMLQRDVHAPNSVDRVLISKMIRLTESNADYLYQRLHARYMLAMNPAHAPKWSQWFDAL